MPVNDVVQTMLSLLEYVLPAAFIWALTDKAVRAIITAATGGKSNGV